MNTIRIIKKRVNFIGCALKKNFYAREFRTKLINYIRSEDIILKDIKIKAVGDYHIYYDFKLEFSHISNYHYRKLLRMFDNASYIADKWEYYYKHKIIFNANSHVRLISATTHLINKLNKADRNYSFRLNYAYGNEIHISTKTNQRELAYFMRLHNINKSFKLWLYKNR